MGGLREDGVGMDVDGNSRNWNDSSGMGCILAHLPNVDTFSAIIYILLFIIYIFVNLSIIYAIYN